MSQNKKDETKKEAPKSENFMDLQTNTLTDLFGSDLSGTPDGKQLNFLELLEQSDLPEEQKKEWRNYYYLQSKELTQKQKDSLSLALHKKMQKAMINNN
ncbi:hypothetical protein DZC72_09300 [Maribacter algicola]|uniref:Uncharacterized protein n=2 Tax=Maribacter algicola TaxID=2498892 RepID=A0A426RNY6_9FLAO|nr:hypothetical protein DZC72_09300 [Maribacter algicola]